MLKRGTLLTYNVDEYINPDFPDNMNEGDTVYIKDPTTVDQIILACGVVELNIRNNSVKIMVIGRYENGEG